MYLSERSDKMSESCNYDIVNKKGGKMVKEKISLFLEDDVIKQIEEIAKESYKGSKSVAAEWLVRTADIEKHYKEMARHHQRQLQHFVYLLECLEEKRVKVINKAEEIIVEENLAWQGINK